MKILCLYDGSLHARTALAYARRKAAAAEDEVVVLHVFNPNVYIDYDAGPNAVELGRTESKRYLEDLKSFIAKDEASSPSAVRIVTDERDPADLLSRYADAENPDLVLVPEKYRTLARSVAAPVTAVPGVILFPFDGSTELSAILDAVLREARELSARVVLLGVVPIHMYSRSEKAELDRVRKTTRTSLHAVEKAIRAEGIMAEVVIREGYPDEEILNATEEFGASLVMVPSGGATPSELAKAASIILEKKGRLRRPLLLIPGKTLA